MNTDINTNLQTWIINTIYWWVWSISYPVVQMAQIVPIGIEACKWEVGVLCDSKEMSWRWFHRESSQQSWTISAFISIINITGNHWWRILETWGSARSPDLFEPAMMPAKNNVNDAAVSAQTSITNMYMCNVYTQKMSLSWIWLFLVRVPDPLAPKASEAGTCLLGWSFHLTSDRGKEDADKDGPGGVHVDDHQVPLVAPPKVPLCLVLAVRDHVALKQEVCNWC